MIEIVRSDIRVWSDDPSAMIEVAEAAARVFARHWLIGALVTDVIEIDCDGVKYFVRCLQ